MNRTEQAAVNALRQLCGSALTASRRGDDDLMQVIVDIIRGHGADGIWMLLRFMADAVINANAEQQNVRPGPDVSIVPEWIDAHSGVLVATLAGHSPDDAWCTAWLMARATGDADACWSLVGQLDTDAIDRVMRHLTRLSARTLNQITGATQ